MTKVGAIVLLASVWAPAAAFADAALFIGEPYGRFGSINPTGHAAVYLTRVCAESPTRLRRCSSGEIGAVISRYHRIAGVDWIAIPLMPYLYAVERADQMPEFADARTVAALRDAYRHDYLRELVPDRSEGSTSRGSWIQLVGAAYDRRIVVFDVATTAAQDDELIAKFNSDRNDPRFNLFFRNCADFARDVINFYYPKALRSSFIADLGLTTPKHLAKSLVRYSKNRSGVRLWTYAIPQIPGSRPDSGGTRSVLESLVKTKKYLVPLTGLQPWLPAGLAAGYLATDASNSDHYGMVTYTRSELGFRFEVVDIARNRVDRVLVRRVRLQTMTH